MTAQARQHKVNNPQLSGVARAFASGDRHALAALYRELERFVLSIARRELGSSSEAEDVSQWVFIKAWESRRSLKDPTRIKAWLAAITVNRARNIRARSSRLDYDGTHPDRHTGPAPQQRQLEVAEERRHLRTAIRQLSPRQQDVITLRVNEDLSFREIGSRLGCSDVSARVNYLYGVRNLRARLAA